MLTRKELAEIAANECCSEDTAAHQGGIFGRPFWNTSAFQFMYVPAFQFTGLPYCGKYRYIAEDEKGATYSFEADNACAPLTPIWRDIPEGIVLLKVYSVDNAGEVQHLIGARTFYKLASFPEQLPPAVCTYKECAMRAFDYAMDMPAIRHWLEHGTPDPNYDYYVYPSKMLSSVIDSMIIYAELRPERAADAMKIAVNAANYLIEHSVGEESPLAGLPLTYQLDFRPEPEKRNNASATDGVGKIMMIYPAQAGISYLNLEEKTGDEKYLAAALRIGKYYLENVQPNGSWHFVRSIETGESMNNNYCSPIKIIVPFLIKLYQRTGDEAWKKLAGNAVAYTEREQLSVYNWEGQFEDVAASANYTNLSHCDPNALIRYYAENFSDSPSYMQCAEELLRFTEDQFVVWTKHAPWTRHDCTRDEFITPAGLEQYGWHVPIDASTATFVDTYLAMYKVTENELYLAKAKALADSITRAQRESGMIPTHWFNEKTINGENFWLNCMFYTAQSMARFSSYLDSKGLSD